MGLIKSGTYYISVSVRHRHEILIDHGSFSVAVNYIKVETLYQVNYLFGTFCPVLKYCESKQDLPGPRNLGKEFCVAVFLSSLWMFSSAWNIFSRVWVFILHHLHMLLCLSCLPKWNLKLVSSISSCSSCCGEEQGKEDPQGGGSSNQVGVLRWAPVVSGDHRVWGMVFQISKTSIENRFGEL